MLLCSACASYRPLPLAGASSVSWRGKLSMSDAVDHAMADNPDLQVARAEARIAQRQGEAAGMLPDPQLALSHDLGGAAPGLLAARSFGVSYDINALFLRASNVDAARADALRAELALRWQEWQLVGQTRSAYLKVVTSAASLRVLEENEALFSSRAARLQAAVERRLATADALAPHAAALQETRQRISEISRQLSAQTHELTALLGLTPDSVLELDPATEVAEPDAQAVATATGALAERRPDLAALRAGYAAQDARYRGALLAQFPALNLGLSRARDSSGVQSTSLGATLTLPVLNGARGAIAIESASRDKLHAEYSQRLAAARNELDRLRADHALTLQAQARAYADLPALEQLASATSRAGVHGLSDALAFATARGALLAKRLELIALQDAVLEQRVALLALLGLDGPPPSKGIIQ